MAAFGLLATQRVLIQLFEGGPTPDRVLQTLMAERVSAPELRSYGLRNFLLRLYDQVMGAQTAEELAVAQRVTTTTSIGAMTGAGYLPIGTVSTRRRGAASGESSAARSAGREPS
jgi:ATP-binding cassette subfamily B protein